MRPLAGAIALLCLAALVDVGAARPQIRVEASPRISTMALRSLRVRAWIEPSDRNRSFVVTVDGDDFFRSSGEQLAGAAAPRVHDVWWERTFVPCGVYTLTAVTVDSTGGVVARATDRAFVCGVPE